MHFALDFVLSIHFIWVLWLSQEWYCFSQTNLLRAHFLNRYHKLDILNAVKALLLIKLVLGYAGDRLSDLIELDLLVFGVDGLLHGLYFL